MAKRKTEGNLVKETYQDFGGGVNLYLGVRQIKDNESPEAVNCDFKGKGGVGNREGYTEVGSPSANYSSGGRGLGRLHTSTYHQLLKFTSNGGDVILEHSSDGSGFTQVTGTTFGNYDIDTIQAGDVVYTANGVTEMRQWSGTAWTTTTNGTIGKYPEYWNKQLWVVDDTNPDQLLASGLWASSSSKLGDFTYNSATNPAATTLTFKPGSGAEITGLRAFKNSLYVFLRDSIYKVDTTATVGTYTVSQITNSVGCVSHRSIVQVEEDLYFAADDGVYALGEVANYVSVRTTNKSAKIVELFANMTASNKMKIAAEYHNFKYHLFYSLYGTENDSCLVYDVRYQGWQDWRNMPANDCVLYIKSTGEKDLYFINPSNSEVYKMYNAGDDNGTTINSYWYSKSFDYGLPDTVKLFMDTTFAFGGLNGTVNVYTIFNDSQAGGDASISQSIPQGGMARDTFGRLPFGDSTNSVTVTNYVGLPLRLRSKGQKFAIQYKVESSGTWELDTITQTYIPFSHYKFPGNLKL